MGPAEIAGPRMVTTNNRPASVLRLCNNDVTFFTMAEPPRLANFPRPVERPRPRAVCRFHHRPSSMLYLLPRFLCRFLCGSAVALLPGFALRANAATFNWNNATGNWSDTARWAGSTAPGGTDATDVLVFGGDVGTTAGTAPNYTATNDLAANPFLLNAITLNATDTANLATDPPHLIVGTNPLRFTGTNPAVTQNGAGPITFNMPANVVASLLLAGNGTGSVTFNKAISGFATLHKTGTSAFRFGTFPIAPALTAPSDNTWVGPLLIDDGTIRFNQNAESGRTALRANAIVFPASGAATPVLSCASELRAGTLSGGIGKVESAVTATNAASEDLVVTALTDGSFAGILRLGPPTGTGNDLGQLVVRGPGVQTVTGTLQIDKDMEIGGTLVFAGSATLGAQTKGALIIHGGTVRLDNTATNNLDRLRDASTTSTGLDPIGGGVFQLIGNSGATTTETVGRVQLGAQTGAVAPFKTKARAGELRLGVAHRSGASFATALTLQSYERDASNEQPLDTVEFSATDGAGAVLNLGSTGNNPRVVIATLPIAVSNGLFNNNTGTASTGWAVVRTTTGLAFATQTAVNNGVTGVATVATWASDAAANVLLSASQTIGATAFSLHSLRLLPGAGQSLSIAAGGTLDVKGLLLTGANDFSITGAGALAGTTPRYIFVDTTPLLTLGVDVGNTAPLVKGGDGTLILTSTANPASTQIFAINRGVVRSALTALPGGELRLRGGVLEITGGGTFNRPLLDGTGISGPGTVNWGNVELLGATPAPTKTDADSGGGGFAALGANAAVDLGALGATTIAWEDKGFVQSGYALVLGSRTATAKLTLVDNLNLTSADVTINYNAREIRVDDNAAVTTDRAVLAGIVAGTVHNDLLKTGAGTLELAAANSFAGMAFVQAGTLVVSGSTAGLGIDLLNGATLAGAGTVTNILLESGARLAPGDGTVATLTATGCTWRSGGVARFDLGAANTADKLALGAGALTRGSASGTFAFDFASTGANNQTYTLATFGSTNFTAADLSATNLAAGVTGHFVVTASALIFSTVPVTPIDTWRQTYFGPGATNSGTAADSADPDGDGLANLDEYLLGGNPTVPSASVRPVLGLAANHDTLSFTRNLSATDVAIRIEASDTLGPGTWTSIATRAVGAGSWTTLAGVTVLDNAGAVLVTDSATTAQSKRFLRLAVDHP